MMKIQSPTKEICKNGNLKKGGCNGCEECSGYRKNNPDVKEMMATLLIQHNLLHGEDWNEFHNDVQKIVYKYYPKYEKGFKAWWKKGKINNNI